MVYMICCRMLERHRFYSLRCFVYDHYRLVPVLAVFDLLTADQVHWQ